jgi:hypothetical protein
MPTETIIGFPVLFTYQTPDDLDTLCHVWPTPKEPASWAGFHTPDWQDYQRMATPERKLRGS